MFIWATFCVWRAGLCLFGLHFVFGGQDYVYLGYILCLEGRIMFIWATFCVCRAGLCLFGLHFVFGGQDYVYLGYILCLGGCILSKI